MKETCYDIADDTDIDLLRSRLGQVFRLAEGTETQSIFDVLDSFDWRLYHRGWLLLHSGRHWEIVERETQRTVENIVVEDNNPKHFCWDFPSSKFSERLGPVLKMRALLPFGSIRKTVTELNLCNQDDKIVVRLQFETFADEGEKHRFVRCRTVLVRGYEKAYRQARSSIEDLSFSPSSAFPVWAIVEKSGVKPGSYSSKSNLSLPPALPATEALRRILQNLVAVMQANLPGILEDVDTEFLHDFRVAVRRSRCLLGELKGVLDPQTRFQLQKELKAMGSMTGTVRDLDVYLLEASTYLQRVPEMLRPGIRLLFGRLKQKRRHAKQRMVKVMKEKAFADALQLLDDFGNSDCAAAGGTANETQPIEAVAKAVIYKRYRRVVKKGRKITDNTADQKLHDLRIDCKKLRYLLEFFSSLFPPDEMKRLVKQLKQLQENLGAFNDLSVQQEFLIAYLGTVKPQTSQVVMLSAAIGALVARLETAQEQVRSQFLRVFAGFNTPSNRKRFETLFGADR